MTGSFADIGEDRENSDRRLQDDWDYRRSQNAEVALNAACGETDRFPVIATVIDMDDFNSGPSALLKLYKRYQPSSP